VIEAGAFTLDSHGHCEQATQICSPNADERPDGTSIRLIVIHNISIPAGEFGTGHVECLFTNTLDVAFNAALEGLADLRVSAHFFIDRSGALQQFVSCERRAWHAGASSWRGVQRCNDFSIGIELEGTDVLPYEDAQYATLCALIQSLKLRYPIEGIAGHEHIAPGRKTDPGAVFDWKRLGEAIKVPHWIADLPMNGNTG
jgi:AmpD protein